jgi:Polyketide cyclase / dehydrase and lipid transport
MAHLTNDFHIGASVETVDKLVKDPRAWPAWWMGMDESPRVIGDGSPGTKAEFTQHMLGLRVRMIERTVEERHNTDGSSDWRWEFSGLVSGYIACHHAPSGDGADVTTTFDYHVPRRLGGRLADRLLVEKSMRHDFEDYLDNLRLLAETARVPTATAA